MENFISACWTKYDCFQTAQIKEALKLWKTIAKKIALSTKSGKNACFSYFTVCFNWRNSHQDAFSLLSTEEVNRLIDSII